MIRKTAAAIAAFLVLLAGTAYAVEYPSVKYGKKISRALNAEGSYFYMYSMINEGFTDGLTDADAHGGTHSYWIDCDSAERGKKIVLEGSVSLSNVDCVNNNVLVEMYIKGFEGDKPGSLSFYLLLTDTAQNTASMQFNIDAADENGWHRAWAFLPHKEISTVRYGTTYERKSYCKMTDCYIDDVAVVYLPMALHADDCTAESDSVSLEDITVVGEDANGMRQKIDLYDVLKYSVVSGDAYIDGAGNIVYTGTQGGTVTLETALYDIKTRFNLTFGGNVATERIVETETAFEAVIENGADTEGSAYLAVVLLDSGRLADISVKAVTLTGGENTVACEKPTVPFYVKNPSYKAFLYFD